MRLRSVAARRSLRAYDARLANVRLLEYEPQRLPEIIVTRLNRHYQPALALARLVLRATAFELRHGHVQATAFLVDMNELFEDFVVVTLRETLGVSPRTLVHGMAGKMLFLDVAKRVSLKPDLSWWDGARCAFVGDVKYKRVTITGVNHPDLYQLLAYTIAADLPGGLLIYAAGEGEPVTHQVDLIGKRLEVATLDLAGTPDELLRQVDGVAQRIQSLQHMALTTYALGHI